ncbi:hypothetical protein [Thalassotalea hakodatensis]|uniref:hypothetical protein n=1 Tax=Thalassotalea hakodatensis TaxID=3030492 RepID=UPI0025741398|nr:hypothetical protein [Thalassotalea hakodatensis]
MKLLIISIINGFIASLISWLLILPVIWVVTFFFSFDINETTNTIVSVFDIIIVIALIGALFEIINRVYIGLKQNRIVGIIRKKEEQW